MSFAAIIRYYQQNTFRCILAAALFFRLLAAIFSTGYGMHDDHFITVEVAQSWIDGTNRDQWLPEEGKPSVPSGHSLTYPGILYGILLACELAGIEDPASKMLIMRLLHALFSMLVVFYGYKIVRKLYDERSAAVAGWLLALYFFMPMMSVRNLVEVVCVPFLMMAVWILVSNDRNKLSRFLLAGFVIGLAFSIRFQTSTFIAGVGLALLLQKKFVPAIVYGAGAIISVFMLQGGVDLIIWGRPFAEFREYSAYNLQHASDYWTGPWYNYLLLVAGLLIPPISLFIMFGFGKGWKKHLLILVPVLGFFIFHSLFPNKQERFIFPVLPFIVMLGAAAWLQFYESSSWWKKHPILHNGLWTFFIVFNSILLCALTLSSSKKNRVDAMRYLAADRNVKCFVVENRNHPSGISMPFFYLQKQWPYEYQLMEGQSLEAFSLETREPGKCRPTYALFMEEENIDKRVAEFKEYFPHLTYLTTIEPSFLDKVMHWLNPVNTNQVTYIYRIN